MTKLRVSKAYFSKIVNGKVPGIKPPKCIRIGRKLLFRAESFEAWLREVEA